MAVVSVEETAVDVEDSVCASASLFHRAVCNTCMDRVAYHLTCREMDQMDPFACHCGDWCSKPSVALKELTEQSWCLEMALC